MANSSASMAIVLKIVEGDLLNLSAEARRAVPAVKDAAERAIYELRGLQRTAGPSSSSTTTTTTATSSSSSSPVDPFAGLTPEKIIGVKTQWLHPFLFACNHVDAPKKVLAVALTAMQRLVTSDGVAGSDMPSLARVLEIQADSTEEDLRLKVLQTLPLLLSQRTYIPDAKLLGQVMALGFNFLRDKSSILKHAATATLQQAVALMFERAEAEVVASATAAVKGVVVGDSIVNENTKLASPSPSPTRSSDTDTPNTSATTTLLLPPTNSNNSVLSACRMFLQDMVLIAGGMPTQWMKRGTPVPRVLAADMLEYAIRAHSSLFRILPEFKDVAATLMIPLLLRQLPTQLSFPLLLRYFRIAKWVLLYLHTTLPVPCRALFLLFIRLVHASAKGEDLGADASTKLGRFGSAGARILKSGHRALGAGSVGGSGGGGGDTTPVTPIPTSLSSGTSTNETGSASTIPAGSSTSATSSSGINMGADESSIMAAVSAIPLGPMPLFKCTLLLETLVSLLCSRSSVITSLFIQYDFCVHDASDSNSNRQQTPAQTPTRRSNQKAGGGGLGVPASTGGKVVVVEHLIDALATLVYRLLVLLAPDDGMMAFMDGGSFSSGGGRESFSTPNGGGGGGNNNNNGSSSSVSRRRSRRVRGDGSSYDAAFDDAISSNARAGGNSNSSSSAGNAANSSNNNAGSNNSSNNNNANNSNTSEFIDPILLLETDEGDEFAVYPGDVDIAIETYARRPLAGLVCADADTHIFTSSAGGLQAALANSAPYFSLSSSSGATGTSTASSSSSSSSSWGSSGIASLAVGAAFSFVSAAASTGTSLISSAASKLSGDNKAGNNLSTNTSGGGDGSDGGGANAAFNIDTVLPPAGIHPASLIVMATEAILAYISAITSVAQQGVAVGDGPRAVPALLSLAKLPPATAFTSSFSSSSSSAAAASASSNNGGNSGNTLRSPTKPTRSTNGTDRSTSDTNNNASNSTTSSNNSTDYLLYVSGTHSIDAARAMTNCAYKSLMQALTIVLESVDSQPILCAILQAYSGLTYSAGTFSLEGPRDALLVNLCRITLPSWDPSPGVSAIAYSLLGHDSSSSSSSSRSGGSFSSTGNGSGGGGSNVAFTRRRAGPPDAKHALSLRCLLSLAHGLGGVLQTCWIVIIDTLEQYAAHIAAIERMYGISPGNNSNGGNNSMNTPARGGGVYDMNNMNGNNSNNSGMKSSSTMNMSSENPGLLDMLRDKQASHYQNHQQQQHHHHYNHNYGNTPASSSSSSSSSAVASSSTTSFRPPRVHALWWPSDATSPPPLLGISNAEYPVDDIFNQQRNTAAAAALSTLNTSSSIAANAATTTTPAQRRNNDASSSSTGIPQLVLVGEEDDDLILDNNNNYTSNTNSRYGNNDSYASNVLVDDEHNDTMQQQLTNNNVNIAQETNTSAFLHVGLERLFASTIHMKDTSLTELIQALSELTITAFAESATAELTSGMQESSSSMGNASARNAVPSTPLQQSNSSGTNNTGTGGGRVGTGVRAATDLFSPEQQAAAEAREIMQNSPATAGSGTSASGGNPYAVVLSGGSVNTGVSSRVGIVDGNSNNANGNTPSSSSSSSSSSSMGLSASAGAQPPFALQRLMQACAHNVWRLGIVWSPLSTLLRVLARNHSASIRRFGVTCLADLAIAYLLQIGIPPSAPRPGVSGSSHGGGPGSGSANTRGILSSPSGGGGNNNNNSNRTPSSPSMNGNSSDALSSSFSSTANGASSAAAAQSANVTQEALLSPFADYWRSPYASSRAECLRALYRIMEEAGASLAASSREGGRVVSILSPHGGGAGGGAGGGVGGRKLGTSSTASTSPSSPSGNGWSVAIGVLFAVACMACEIEPTASSSSSSSSYGSSSESSRTPSKTLNLMSPSSSTNQESSNSNSNAENYDKTAASYGAAEGLYFSILPPCIFALPDRHAVSLQAQKQPLLAEAFRAIQLIADDFLEVLPHADLSFLILVLGLCIRQNFDVNARLTSVGLLWKISDRLAQARGTGGVSVNVYNALWRQLFLVLLSASNGSETIVIPTSAAGGGGFNEGSQSSGSGDASSSSSSSQQQSYPRVCMFPTPAAKQQAAHRPDEAEVRNSAVQALFSCLIAHGSVMGDDMWAITFNQHVLSLIYEITTVAQVHSAEDSTVQGETVGTRRGGGNGGNNSNNNNNGEERTAVVRLMLHHSRDTLSKQWNETRIIAYQGLVRTMGSCFTRLATFPWFFDAWTDVLAVLERSVAGRQRGLLSGGPAAPMTPSNSGQQQHHSSSRSPPVTPLTPNNNNNSDDAGSAAIFLEPATVSVAGMGCLQELAMLVCVPAGPGHPVDEDDRFSFDMRVVDGALVRITPTNATSASRSRTGSTATGSNTSSSGSTAPSSSSAAAGATTTTSAAPAVVYGVDPALRDRMWQDVRSVLKGIVECAAVTVEEEETVAVAVVDAVTAVITAGSDVSVSAAGGRPRSLAEDTRRFSDTLSMLWSVLDARRRYRWAHMNAAAITSGNKISAEELVGPKIDIPTNAERAVMRSLEKISTTLRTVSARSLLASSTWTGTNGSSASSFLPAKEMEPVVQAWLALLEFLRKSAALDDALYTVDFVKNADIPAIALTGLSKAARAAVASAASSSASGSGTSQGNNNTRNDLANPGSTTGGSLEVALPPPALATLALKLLHKMYAPEPVTSSSSSSSSSSTSHRRGSGSSNDPTSSSTGKTRLEDAVQACMDTAFERAFPVSVSLLAQALLHVREVTDRAVAEVDAAADAAANKSAVVAAGTKSPATGSAASSATTNTSGASSSGHRGGDGGRSMMLDQTCAQAGLGNLVAGYSKNHTKGSGSNNNNNTVTGIEEATNGNSNDSSSSRSTAVTRDVVYPIKVWGFGLGGSYGTTGDGSLIIADASKTKRFLARSKLFSDNLMATLVAVIRHRLCVSSTASAITTAVGASATASPSSAAGGGDSASSSSSSSSVDIWLSLLTTLEVLLGFNPACGGGITSISSAGSGSVSSSSSSSSSTSFKTLGSVGGLSSPMKQSQQTQSRLPTDVTTSISRFFEGIVFSIDADSQALVTYSSTSASGTVSVSNSSASSPHPVKIDAKASIRFDACQAGTDASMWVAVARLYKAVMGGGAGTSAAAGGGGSGNTKALPPTPPFVSSSSTSAAPAAFDSLRGFIGPGSAVTPALVDPILRSRTYGAALRHLGWQSLRNIGDSGVVDALITTGNTSSSAENATNAEGGGGGPIASLEAEVFLLSALLEGYSGLLQADATVTTHAFIALTKRLFSLLVAGTTVLGINTMMIMMNNANNNNNNGSSSSSSNTTDTSSTSSSSTSDATTAATADFERRRRAFGRLCFGALLQFSGLKVVSAGSAKVGVDVDIRSRSSTSASSGNLVGTPQDASPINNNSSSSRRRGNSSSSTSAASNLVATSVAREIRLFCRRAIQHAACRSLFLHSQLEVGIAHERSAARVLVAAATAAASSSSGSTAVVATKALLPPPPPAGPCPTLVVDATYMLTVLRHIIEEGVDLDAAGGGGSATGAGSSDEETNEEEKNTQWGTTTMTTKREAAAVNLMLPYRTLVAIGGASEPLLRYQVQTALRVIGDKLFASLV